MKQLIAHIAQKPDVHQLITQFHQNTDAVRELLIAIQQIPAPTFAEAKRAGFVQAELEKSGLADVQQDAIHNVFARLPGRERGARPLIISAHTDTVFPADTPLDVRCEGEHLIHGPGIGDNSAGVAGLLTLAAALRRSDVRFKRDIWFVANVGEEGLGDLKGMQAVVARFGAAAAYVVIEGGLYGQISYQAIGVARYRITIRTEGGHSWGDFGKESAIHRLGEMISRISVLRVPKKPKTSFNVGVIEGGTSINTIAQEASCLVDLRSADPGELARLVLTVQELAYSFRSGSTAVEMTRIGRRPAGALNPQHRLVRLSRAALEYAGCSRIGEIASSTDANIPLSQGHPAICIGLAEARNAHRRDEYIDLRNFPRGMTQLLLLTHALAA